MSDTHEQNNIETLRHEFNTLKEQLEKLMKAVEDKKDETSADIAAKLARELEHYRTMAADNAHKIYDAGQAGIEEIGEHVRNNPLASLLIAFGAGCVISCLLKRFK